MAEATGKLMKLKAKLTEIALAIEDAEARKNDAKHGMVEARTRCHTLEIEVQSVDRKIQLLKQELELAHKRKAETESKLKDTETESANIDESRKELEQNECAGDEQIQSLEEQVKNVRQQLEENKGKLREQQRKDVVIKRDIERATSQGDALETRVRVLSDTIKNARDALAELEEREGKASNMEEMHEEEQLLLEGQYKEAEVAAEDAMRSLSVIERTIRETEEEIKMWEEKSAKLQAEMDQMDTLGELDSDLDE